ncbi:MAG: methyltransferase domain-containing protein [Spirochaetales bacterium]|nr:methyltransferase domain-containing protein [Spirochaetales bacterium]
MKDERIGAIQVRYSDLAESDCCLSCGGAINHAEPREGEKCLDLGSGRGNDVIRMAQAVGETGMAYGIDISPGMIEKAEKNAAKLGVSNASFIHSELTKLPIVNNFIDLIISNCTINHVADKQALWNEVYRILKPGGRFSVSDIYSVKDVPAEWATDPEKIAECWAGAVTKDSYLLQLEKAGFKEITIIEESTPYKKGEIEVVSITFTGKKAGGCGCGCQK